MAGDGPPPGSLNKRPKKRLEGLMEEAEETLALPFDVVSLPDGRLGRRCCASQNCVYVVARRKSMIDHLAQVHGMEVDVPKLLIGCPHADKRVLLTSPHPLVESWKRQAYLRARNKMRKFEINRHKYEKSLYPKAEQNWNDLRKEFKLVPKEEFVVGWVKRRMDKYMLTASTRLAKIEERINKKELESRDGAESSRKKTTIEKEILETHEDDESYVDSKGKKPIEKEVDYGSFEPFMSGILKENLRESGSLQGVGPSASSQGNANIKPKESGSLEGVGPSASSQGNANIKPKASRATRKKLTIKSSCGVKKVIEVSSRDTPRANNKLQLQFEISSLHVHVIEKGGGRMVTRGNIARSRLASSVDMDFIP